MAGISMPDSAEDDDRILGLLSELTGGIVTGFVVVAEFTDVDGEGRLYGNSLRNQRSHTTLGLLEYGATVERGRCDRAFFEDE